MFISALLLALLLGGTRPAKAGFILSYDLANFTLTNSTFANGYATPIDGGESVLLTGPNDGSGQPGTTDFTIAAAGGGLWQFDWSYTTLDPLPGWDVAGYLIDGFFFSLADTKGHSGTVTVAVDSGDVIGFRIQSADNLGEPGRFLVTNFSAPEAVPEPGGIYFMIMGSILIISLRIRKSGSRWVRRVAPILAAAAMCAPSPVRAQSQMTFLGGNATGQLTRVRVVNLTAQAQPSLGAVRPGIAETLPKIPPKRLLPPRPLFMTQPAAASANSLTISNSFAGMGFNALSHLDQRNANHGNQFSVEPPNTGIAVANGFVLEGVNNAVQVYSLTGTPALPLVVSTNQLFGLAPAIDRITGINGPFPTDMRVYYDQGMNRWIVLQRAQDYDIWGYPLNSSHLYMAVSTTLDPRGDYNIYVMDTTNAAYPGCPCIADYPQIGSDQYGFHIAWNQFNTLSQSFVNAAILSISKAGLASGAATPTAYQFMLPMDTNFNFSIQPATTAPKASNLLAYGGIEYFVSSTVYGGGQIALWAMQNTSSLTTAAPSPVLLRVTIPTLNYTYPEVAQQKPGPIPYGTSVGGTLLYLDSGDARVQALSYASGRLYLTLPTGVRDESDRLLTGGAYIVLSPTYRSGVLAATVLNEGYLLVNNNNLLRPAIAVNAAGQGAIAVTLVGPDWYPTAAAISIDTFSTPTSVEVAGLGALPEDGFSGYPADGGTGVARWGDYNAAVATSDGDVWMAVQYIGNYPRSEYANWNTYIMRKQPASGWPGLGAVRR